MTNERHEKTNDGGGAHTVRRHGIFTNTMTTPQPQSLEEMDVSHNQVVLMQRGSFHRLPRYKQRIAHAVS
jgi:hypothetical protein